MKKATIILILVTILLGQGLFVVKAVDNNQIVLPVKEGQGSIAYTEIAPETLVFGPESFAVGNNGNIFVLDSVDNQVETFNKKGEYLNTVDLNPEDEYIDIEVKNNGSFVLISNDGKIKEYDSRGNCILLEDTKDAKSIGFYSLYKNEKSEVLLNNRLEGKEKQLNSDKQSVQCAVDIYNVEGEIHVSYLEDEFIVDYDYTPAGTYPIGFTKSQELLLIENEILMTPNILLETRVGKYKDGSLIANALAFSVDNNNYVTRVPHKYIYATNNGEVFQMLCRKNGIVIAKLEFSKERKTILNEMDLLMSVTKINTLSTSRSQESLQKAYNAYLRTADIIGFQWVYDPSTMKTKNVAPRGTPDHLRGDSISTQYTIPYKWGGMNGYDTYDFSSYKNFIDEIYSGKTAGDINTSLVTSDTTGLDCSGFISACYKVPYKLGTSTMSNKFRNGTASDIFSSGDIYNKSGVHVFMPDGPIYNVSLEIVGYWTIECTTDGYEDTAKSYSRSIADVSTYTWMVWDE